jgi:2-polyprenyl-3-methyl-5-hydroxy-6-metoxy-1,4-benzoquinol methylase
MRVSIKPHREGCAVKCIVCSTLMVPRFGGDVTVHWRCPHCGLESIWPQPDDQSLSAIYSDQYFSYYKSTIDPQLTRSMKRATFARQLRRLSFAGPLPKRRRLLDCGAATGILAELAKEQGWDAFAIEFSEFGADACAKLLGSDHVYRGEVRPAFFAANPENRFEAITMCDFIEHVRDPREVLSWAKERLMPGGVLLLTTPEAGTISWRLMGRHWFHYVPEHLWFLNPESIRMLLRESGFTDVAISPARKTFTVEYALACYDRSTTTGRTTARIAQLLRSLLPGHIRRLSFRLYSGQMFVTAHANGEGTPGRVGDPATEIDQLTRECVSGKAV